MKRWLLILCAALCTARSVPAFAHEPQPDFLVELTRSRSFSLGRPQEAQPTPDGKAVLFLRSTATDPKRSLYELDIATKQTRLIASAETLLGGADEKLDAQERARRERQRMIASGIATYQLSSDGTRIATVLSGIPYVIERQTAKARALPVKGPVLDARFSPDSKRLAYVRDRDLYVFDLVANQERRLTTSPSPMITYGLAEFIAQEELDRSRGYWWSPDSTRIVFQETDVAGVEVFHIADPAHPEAQPDPWPYPRAGRNNAKVRLAIANANENVNVRYISWDQTRLPYLANVTWTKNAPLTLTLLTRTQKHLELVTVDEKTLALSPLLVNEDPAWINLDPDLPKWSADGKSFLWSSDRSGERNLESYSRDTSSHRSEWNGYVSLCGVDADNRVTYLARESTVPSSRMLVSDGRSTSRIAGGVNTWVKDARCSGGNIVYTETSLEEMERTFVFTSKNERIELPSVGLEPGIKCKIELADHHAIVWPADYKPNTKKKLPVIVYVYAGPHVQLVTQQKKTFLLHQWMANQGFAVVIIDGRGSAGGDREWERAILGDFSKVQLDDQIAGLDRILRTHSDLDRARVGIHGWSFGGYMAALATLTRPDIYKVGVAGAPVIDWADYDTAYTERYLGLPSENPKGYARSSVLSHVNDMPKLARPLLIIHGSADDNVYFFHSMKLAHAMEKAGRTFDFLPLPGQTHMVSDPVIRAEAYRRTFEYLSLHLRAHGVR